MNKERSKIKIDNRVLYYILDSDAQEDLDLEDVKLQKELSKYNLVETKINGHDECDGGAFYEAIIKELSTNTFYRVNYNDWDLNHQDSYGPYDEEAVTLDEELFEVFPIEKITIVYE